MSDWYYVDASGTRRGPHEAAALVALAGSGEIHTATRVWRGGMARWQPLSECAAELGLDPARLVPPPAAPAEPVTTPPSQAPALELTTLGPAEQDAIEAKRPDATLPADPSANAVPPPIIAPVWHHAGLAKRFAAFMIDELILTVALMPVMLIVALVTGASAGSPEAAAMNLLRLVATWLYFSWCESSSLRGTIGKRALGLYVTRPHGAGLSFGRASARFIAKILGAMAFMIGIFMIAVHPQRQGLHDQVTDTYVVADNAEKLTLKPFEWILIALGVFVVLAAMSALQPG